ncbi:MAG TPA: hypothetical protein VL984_05990 [Acidimicrobiales bacterium]|nr:hypothetical protein [Acidimicrobiales bacterium]
MLVFLCVVEVVLWRPEVRGLVVVVVALGRARGLGRVVVVARAVVGGRVAGGRFVVAGREPCLEWRTCGRGVCLFAVVVVLARVVVVLWLTGLTLGLAVVGGGGATDPDRGLARDWAGWRTLVAGRVVVVGRVVAVGWTVVVGPIVTTGRAVVAGRDVVPECAADLVREVAADVCRPFPAADALERPGLRKCTAALCLRFGGGGGLVVVVVAPSNETVVRKATATAARAFAREATVAEPVTLPFVTSPKKVSSRSLKPLSSGWGTGPSGALSKGRSISSSWDAVAACTCLAVTPAWTADSKLSAAIATSPGELGTNVVAACALGSVVVVAVRCSLATIAPLTALDEELAGCC